MVNYWLTRRFQRKLQEFQNSLYSHIYLTFGHARLSALTYKEIHGILPFIIKLRDKLGLTIEARSLFREMLKREKQWAGY
jgi:hypothetical protein